MGKNLKINMGYDNPTIADANTISAQVSESDNIEKDNILTPPVLRQERQRGRPKKEESELRSERLSVALTRQQVKDMQDLSAASGIGTSEIIRMVIERLIEAQDMDKVRRIAQEREESKIQL